MISHGFAEISDPWLSITLQPDGQSLTIIAEDNGTPFDPLKQAPPDVSSPLGDRAIGGLGIFMLRKLCSKISYQREDQRNRLEITKSLIHSNLQPIREK